MPKKKKNPECMELKNINYKSMLLKNKIIVDINKVFSQNAEELLEKEMKSNKKKQWNKLSMTVKNKKIKKYANKYALENDLNNKNKVLLNKFLKKLLINNKITRNKDVKYDVSTGELLCVLNISFNPSNNRFTLKSNKSKKSVLSGIYKGKTLKDKNSKDKNSKDKNTKDGEK